MIIGEAIEMALLQAFKNPVEDVEIKMYYVETVRHDQTTNMYYCNDATEMMEMIVQLSVSHVMLTGQLPQ